MRDDYDKNVEDEFKKRLQVEINIRHLKKEIGNKEPQSSDIEEDPLMQEEPFEDPDDDPDDRLGMKSNIWEAREEAISSLRSPSARTRSQSAHAERTVASDLSSTLRRRQQQRGYDCERAGAKVHSATI